MNLDDFVNLGKSILESTDPNLVHYGVEITDFNNLLAIIESFDEKNNLHLELGILASLPIFLTNNANIIEPANIDALISKLLQKFEQIQNDKCIEAIYEVFIVLSNMSKNSVDVILGYIRNIENKNTKLKSFLLLAYIYEILAQSAEDSLLFLQIMVNNFANLNLEFQIQSITQICSFALSIEDSSVYVQLIDLIWHFILSNLNLDYKTLSSVVYDFGKLLHKLEMSESELKSYIPESLNEFMQSLESNENRIEKIPRLLIISSLMNVDMFANTIKNILVDFSKVSDFLLDTKFCEYINSSEFSDDHLSVLWDILRPALDDSELASAAVFVSAAFCDALNRQNKSLSTFLASRISTLLKYDNTDKSMLILSLSMMDLLVDLDKMMIKSQILPQIFKVADNELIFISLKKTLKKLMNHDKIEIRDVVKCIANMGEFDLSLTPHVFSILEYAIYIGDKDAVIIASRLILSYLQNENAPSIIRSHAIGCLPVFAKSYFPDLFVDMVMIGCNNSFKILSSEIDLVSISSISRFLASAVAMEKITDYETFVLPFYNFIVEATSVATEDAKSSSIALESASILCEKIENLEFPYNSLSDNILSNNERRICAAITAASHVINRSSAEVNNQILAAITKICLTTKNEKIIKAIFNYFIEVVIALNYLPKEIDEIIMLSFIGRLPFYNNVPFYSSDKNDVDFYDLLNEVNEIKNEKYVQSMINAFHMTNYIEEFSLYLVSACNNNIVHFNQQKQIISVVIENLILNSDDSDIIDCYIKLLDALWTASDRTLETPPILNAIFDVYNEGSTDLSSIPPFVLKLLPKSPPNGFDFNAVHSMLDTILAMEHEYNYPAIIQNIIEIYRHNFATIFSDIAVVLASFITLPQEELSEMGFSKKLIAEAQESLRSLLIENEPVRRNVFMFFSGKPDEKLMILDLIEQ